jgi:uncharacterized protein (TIGR02598 family)
MLKSTECESRLRSAAAFSLIELTLALGVAAFCLIAVFGLVPVGVQTNRNATSQTAATNILSNVVSDIRASPPGQGKSKKYQINKNKGVPTKLYFDGQGQSQTAALPPPNSRYRLDTQVTKAIQGGAVYPTYIWLKVSWPAESNPTRNPPITPSGSVETVATFFP